MQRSTVINKMQPRGQQVLLSTRTVQYILTGLILIPVSADTAVLNTVHRKQAQGYILEKIMCFCFIEKFYFCFLFGFFKAGGRQHRQRRVQERRSLHRLHQPEQGGGPAGGPRHHPPAHPRRQHHHHRRHRHPQAGLRIRINLSCRILIRIQIADPNPDPGGQQ